MRNGRSLHLVSRTYHNSGLWHFKLLIKRLLIAYFVFTISRLLFYIFNYAAFNQFPPAEIIKAFVAGLLFDTSAIFYLNGLFILLHIIPVPYRDSAGWQKSLKYLFILTNSLAVFFNLIDLAWFPFANKRAGIEIFDMLPDVSQQIGSYLTDYWYLILVIAGFVVLLNRMYNKTMKQREKVKVKILPELGLFILVAAVWVVGARGGFYLKPIQPYDAARFVSPELIPLTLNTPFQLFSTLQQKGVEPLAFFDREQADALYSPHHQYSSSISFNRENVVLIIIESLGKEYVGYYNQGKGYTPFLDSLCKQSLVFENAYANCKRSIEALPTLLSGIPSWMPEPYIGSYYQSNKVSSLGKLLSGKGYDASFYHGGHNGTMGFDNYVRISGSGKYFGMDEYPDEKDYDGSWGIFDEPYLQYYCNELDKKPVPFVSAVFTLSSHHPYPLPEKYKDSFPKGEHPIHAGIGYTDLSIANFFTSAKKKSWYSNTLFVIVADHSAENITDKYQSAEGRYAIPLLFFKGDGSLRGSLGSTTQQADIINMVLAHLHFADPFISFGKNAMDTTNHENSWAMQYDNGIYQLIDHPGFIQFKVSPPELIGFNNPTGTAKEAVMKRREMEEKLKAIIQQYHFYLINNKMTIK